MLLTSTVHHYNRQHDTLLNAAMSISCQAGLALLIEIAAMLQKGLFQSPLSLEQLVVRWPGFGSYLKCTQLLAQTLDFGLLFAMLFNSLLMLKTLFDYG